MGQVFAQTNDLNNRSISMCYSDGKEVAFRYNSRGELVEMKDWNGITTLEYNPTGKLTKVTDHNGQVTGYDAAGRRTGITYPDGSKAGYTYDKNHRLSTVTDALGQMTQYQYDAVGYVLSIQQPGSKATCSYNAGGLPTQMKYSFDDGTFMEETLTYDAMGRILGREQTGSSSELANSDSYAYDALGQLLTCKEGAVTEAYGYDALGNRLFKDVDGIRKATYQYNGLNQLVGRTENGISYGYGYDKRGNLTEERCGDSLIRQYTYDVTNHLVLGKNLENGEKTEYGYNGLYMRVKNV